MCFPFLCNPTKYAHTTVSQASYPSPTCSIHPHPGSNSVPMVLGMSHLTSHAGSHWGANGHCNLNATYHPCHVTWEDLRKHTFSQKQQRKRGNLFTCYSLGSGTVWVLAFQRTLVTSENFVLPEKEESYGILWSKVWVVVTPLKQQIKYFCDSRSRKQTAWWMAGTAQMPLIK